MMGVEEAPIDEQDYASEADQLADMIADIHRSGLTQADMGQLAAVPSSDHSVIKERRVNLE